MGTGWTLYKVYGGFRILYGTGYLVPLLPTLSYFFFHITIGAPVFGTLNNAITNFQTAYNKIVIIYSNVAGCSRTATFGVIINHSSRQETSMGFCIMFEGAEVWFLLNTGAYGTIILPYVLLSHGPCVFMTLGFFFIINVCSYCT